jgi:hypothetical protein
MYLIDGRLASRYRGVSGYCRVTHRLILTGNRDIEMPLDGSLPVSLRGAVGVIKVFAIRYVWVYITQSLKNRDFRAVR